MKVSSKGIKFAKSLQRLPEVLFQSDIPLVGKSPTHSESSDAIGNSNFGNAGRVTGKTDITRRKPFVTTYSAVAMTFLWNGSLQSLIRSCECASCVRRSDVLGNSFARWNVLQVAGSIVSQKRSSEKRCKQGGLNLRYPRPQHAGTTEYRAAI
jgi:hypothetical protein